MAANRKSSKTIQRPAIAERQRIQISPSVEIAKRFRLAAVSLNLSETELFERLIDLNFPGLHVQNLSKSPFFGEGKGGGSDSPDQLTISIPRSSQTVASRISQIARASGMPVDSAIESFGDDPGQS